jgi:hypothetical protein
LGRTALSKRELQGGGILARVKAGELRLNNAPEVMRISYRQAKRLWKRYQAGGTAALKHGNAGRKSNRARSHREIAAPEPKPVVPSPWSIGSPTTATAGRFHAPLDPARDEAAERSES